MAFGVTPDGFFRKPVDKIRESIFAYLRAKISSHLNLTDKTGLGNVAESAVKELDALWGVAEGAYSSNDPDKGDDHSKIATALITGTKAKNATKGTVLCTCNFNGRQTYQPGSLIAHVDGDPTNRWVNRDTIVTTSSGTYAGLRFECESTGPKEAPAGQLTVIAQTHSGWNSITNPVDASVGEDVETIDQLMARRELELSFGGKNTIGAIRRDVSRVNGVFDVKVQENKTDYWGFLPPHSFRVIVWDGDPSAAEDDDIAQAIVDNGGATRSIGLLSGTGVDADGNEVVANFDRVAGVPIYVAITVKGSGVGVAQAIVDEGKKFGAAKSVVLDKLKGAAVRLSTVSDCLAFTLGTAPSPVGTDDIPITLEQISTFDIANVDVTVVP